MCLYTKAMFEVRVPCVSNIRYVNGKFTQNDAAGAGIIEYHSRVKDDGVLSKWLTPRDDVCKWLLTFCPSWVTLEEHLGGRSAIPGRQAFWGMVFGFTDAKDAMLFKLRWHNV